MDWSDRKVFIVIAIIITAMTIPRVFIGFGVNGDDARTVRAVDNLLRSGIYTPSRLPGNPLFEYMIAAIHPWAGNVGTSIMVLLFFMAGIFVFFRIAEILAPKNTILLTSIFALMPILVKNAVVTIDYIPGLCLLLTSFLFTLKRMTVLSGVFLGLAIGFRITNSLALAPLLLYLYLQGFKLRDLTILVLLAISIGLGFYIPIFRSAGLNMLAIHPTFYEAHTYVFRTFYNVINLFGIIPTLALITIFAKHCRVPGNLRSAFCSEQNATVYFEVSMVALFLLLFILHSDRTEYLIPCVPFILFLLARLLNRKELIILGLLLFSYSLINIELKGGPSGDRELKPKLSMGIVLNDWLDRLNLEDLRNEIYHLGSQQKTVV